ncbi:MAG: FadR/GntR family transcriptional regulator [Oscillospiraceae bacterium]|nr:FadR family transcriptional regulator [Bacillota bacterium]
MGPQIPQRLTDQTADRLLHMIDSNPAYPPGAKLPNEPRLCQLFGVSRTTLREAVRSLAAQGYVEVRRGSGTFVLDRSPAPDIGLQRLECLRTRLRDLFEIRMMLEPQAARLACLRGTDEELQEIARRAECVAQAIREGKNFSQPEETFHQAFVAATHNPFMEQLLPIIHNALHEAWAALDVESLLAQPTLQDNELLMGFLRQRDEEGVQYAMAAHIRHTINLLDQAGFGSV